MADHLEELFSPARLRKKWGTPLEQAGRAIADAEKEHPSKACFEKLKRLIEESFSGSDLMTLNLLLQSLQDQLEPVWSCADEEPVDAKQKTDIYQLLETIEDLAEAYEIGGRRIR